MLGLGPHPHSISSDGKCEHETEEGCHLGIHSSRPLPTAGLPDPTVPPLK